MKTRGRPKGSTNKFNPDKKVRIKPNKSKGLRTRTYRDVHADDGSFLPMALMDQYGRILNADGNPSGRCGSANH